MCVRSCCVYYTAFRSGIHSIPRPKPVISCLDVIIVIRYANSLTLTGTLKESVRAEAGDFPFEAIEADLARFEGRFSPWHWHEYVEFAWVVGGVLECHTPDGILTLSPGEGCFVNANVLHADYMAPGCGQTCFRVIQMGPVLLSGAGLIHRRYLSRVTQCAGLKAMPFSLGNARHEGILSGLREAFDLAAAEPEGWELRILQVMLEVWAGLCDAAAPMLEQGAAAVRDDMALWTKAMLHFIHENYAEPIAVEDIARAASISQREAYRAFQKVLGTTPTLYLSRHRINVAARMLRETGQSVTDVAAACGFSTPNYFCKVFRDVMGKSPRDFRKA